VEAFDLGEVLLLPFLLLSLRCYGNILLFLLLDFEPLVVASCLG